MQTILTPQAFRNHSVALGPYGVQHVTCHKITIISTILEIGYTSVELRNVYDSIAVHNRSQYGDAYKLHQVLDSTG